MLDWINAGRIGKMVAEICPLSENCQIWRKKDDEDQKHGRR